MRAQPAALEAARARVRLTLGTDGAARLRGRRARPARGLRDVAPEALLPAADPAILARVLDTAAAIAHGHEIAAVIDGPGRAVLAGGLGEKIRRLAVRHRRHSVASPAGAIDAASLLERIAATRAEVRALWSWGLPPALAGLVPAVAAPVADRERLAACLAVATEATLGARADG